LETLVKQNTVCIQSYLPGNTKGQFRMSTGYQRNARNHTGILIDQFAIFLANVFRLLKRHFVLVI